MLVEWSYQSEDGQRRVQRAAFELKVWRDSDHRNAVTQGTAQLDDYLARLGLDVGTLVVFDARSSSPPPHERTRFEDVETASGRRISILHA